MPDRRQPQQHQPPHWLPYVMMTATLVGLLISGCSCVLGPVFGAVVAIGGTYVRGAVMEQRLTSIEGKVDKLVTQSESRAREDGKTESTLADYDRRISEAKDTANQALARAANAEKALAVVQGQSAAKK